MRTSEMVMVETEIKTYGCDLCDYTIKHNSGCCGTSPIMVCNVCKKDCCTDCRTSYYEGGGDYHDWLVCAECKPLADVAWELAGETAGRYDAMDEVAMARLEEIKNGEWKREAEEYKNRKPKERMKPVDLFDLYEEEDD